jgi:hypothetical protein
MWGRPPCLARLVVVSFFDGTAIKGVLWKSRGTWLLFKEAAVVRIGTSSTLVEEPLEGEVLIERDRIRYMQVL